MVLICLNDGCMLASCEPKKEVRAPFRAVVDPGQLRDGLPSRERDLQLHCGLVHCAENDQAQDELHGKEHEPKQVS